MVLEASWPVRLVYIIEFQVQEEILSQKKIKLIVPKEHHSTLSSGFQTHVSAGSHIYLHIHIHMHIHVHLHIN